MTGVPRHIAEHRLNIREGCLPVRKKKRGQAPERNKSICEEVEKLLDADIMKEVHYHSWLLKNVGATYQCLVDKAFQKQIGQNLEVYVHDLVIKSRTGKEVIRDIEETFKTFGEINMKLNPKKCAFGMREGTFLGYKVDTDGLRGPEVNYTPMEKLILTLEEHDIHYRPRTSIKGQILADFIVERPEEDPLDTPMEDKEELPDPWVLFMYGSSCIDGSRAGLIIMNPEGMEFIYALRFSSMLPITKQTKEPGMIKYLEKVKNLADTFKEFSIKQVPGGENKKADALSKMASTSFAHLSKQVLVEELKEKLIDEKEVLAVVEEEGHTWMTPIYEYLTEVSQKKRGRQDLYAARQVGSPPRAKEPTTEANAHQISMAILQIRD
ncbi:reverse transcriptase domain-containing protein [Tanacetum coccineum]